MIEIIQDNTKMHELIRLTDNAIVVVTHELKSPLAAITTLTRTILEVDIPEDKRERFLYKIVSRAESASTMIDEFLTLSAISIDELDITPKKLNFYNEIIENTLEQQQEIMAERGMSARVDVPRELEIICDQKYMQIVYKNLVNNAVKYGTVSTEIYLGYIGIQDGYHYFSVINAGEWIKEGDRERIFEKHVTLGRRGTGLGLHTAREIIRKHGGDIWTEPCYFATGRWIEEKSIANETMIAEEYLDKLLTGNSFVFSIPAKNDG